MGWHEVNFDGLVGPTHNYGRPVVRQRRLARQRAARVQPEGGRAAGFGKDAGAAGPRYEAGGLAAA